jgi:hypothetical protein
MQCLSGGAPISGFQFIPAKVGALVDYFAERLKSVVVTATLSADDYAGHG